MNRRDIFRLTAGALCAGAVRAANETNKPRIRSAQLGKPVQLAGSGGDTWIATWADDDLLYVTSDDTSGFRKACSSNLAINRISGEMAPHLTGETVNCMKDYGGGSETRKEDGGMWKACGLTSVDGILYMAVSRHLTCPTEPDRAWEGRYSPFFIQEAWDGSAPFNDRRFHCEDCSVGFHTPSMVRRL